MLEYRKNESAEISRAWRLDALFISAMVLEYCKNESAEIWCWSAVKMRSCGTISVWFSGAPRSGLKVSRICRPLSWSTTITQRDWTTSPAHRLNNKISFTKLMSIQSFRGRANLMQNFMSNIKIMPKTGLQMRFSCFCHKILSFDVLHLGSVRHVNSRSGHDDARSRCPRTRPLVDQKQNF